MVEKVMYGVGFFAVTLIIQVLLSKRNHSSKIRIWEGANTVVAICILGLVFGNINYFAAICGFVLADNVGRKSGWHN